MLLFVGVAVKEMITKVLTEIFSVYFQFFHCPSGLIGLFFLQALTHLSLSLPSYQPRLSLSVWSTVSVPALAPLQPRGKHHKPSTLPSFTILSYPSPPHLILFPLVQGCKGQEHFKNTVGLLPTLQRAGLLRCSGTKWFLKWKKWSGRQPCASNKSKVGGEEIWPWLQ